MTRLTVYGRLTAAEDRTLTGLLVPFGRPGQTNLGRVVVPDATHIEAPDDVSALFASLDHLDGRDPVADWTGLEATPDGYVGTWQARETHGGDKLLAEFRAGERTGISMELEPVTVRDGVARGRLIGCAFPKAPAFPEARLVAELAPDTAPAEAPPADAQLEAVAADLAAAAGLPDWSALDEAARAPFLEAARTALEAVTPAPDQPTTLAAAATETPEAAGPGNTTPDGGHMNTSLLAGAAAAPAGLAPTGAPVTTRERLLAADASVPDAMRLLASLSQDRGRLLAALTDIIPANTVDRDQPQWLGQIWQGNAYQRRIWSLLNTGNELTDLKVKGWKWVQKPSMERYAGNKAAIPSGPVSTAAYEDEAVRFATGNDIDIKYRHFNDAAFFQAYFEACNESYSRRTDEYAMEVLKAEALPTVPGSVPSGVPAGWAAVVDAALDIIDVATPTFALVEKSVYRDMFLTGQDKFLEFLNASMGFEEGQLNGFKILPVASSAVGTASSPTGLDRGEIIVGAGPAIKARELGGGTPIRVDALNLAQGGVDEAVFGYAHVGVEDARALRIVDLTADA